MDRIDGIIAAQAIYSELGKRLKTNTEGNARGELDGHFRDLRDRTGARSFDLRINGQEVGTYSFAKSKGKAAYTLRIENESAYRRWCEENGLMELPSVASVAQWVEYTGELPEGATIERTPAETTERGTLRVDFEKVKKAVGGDFAPALQAVNELPEGSVQ